MSVGEDSINHMNLIITDKYMAYTDARLLGYQGETNARTIKVAQPHIDEATAYRLIFDCGNDVIYEADVTDGEYIVDGGLLINVGTVKCQWQAVKLVGDTYELVAKSNVIEFEVKPSIQGDVAPIPTYEQSKSALDEVLQAAEQAQDAEAAAEAAAEVAEQAKTEAVNAAETAIQKAAEAEQSAALAAESAAAAGQSKTTAETAAEKAAENANAAALAAESVSKVNISAVQTETGATITVTDREGTVTTVHIDTIAPINTWEDVKNAVRRGLGEKLFPVGYEFTTEDSVTGAVINWVVRGHNHHAAANGKLEYTMTLEAKYVYGAASGTYKSLVFDAAEALYYAAEELPAGTYNFTWDFATGSMVNGTYQFTLTTAVPAGGQIVLGTKTTSTAITDCKIATYATVAATAAIESGIVVTEGSEGTSLGTIAMTSATSENLNCAQRITFGSNNYAQSAVRQWLNSDAAAGSVWTPTNKFDLPPSWNTSYSGFMRGLPADFLAAVQPAVIPFRTNSVFEINSLDGTEYTVNKVYELQDKFFLLSRPEIFGDWDSPSIKDGEQLEYYEGLTKTERIKYDAAGLARPCCLRSPNLGYASQEHGVNPSGALDNYSAIHGTGVTPACIIA